MSAQSLKSAFYLILAEVKHSNHRTELEIFAWEKQKKIKLKHNCTFLLEMKKQKINILDIKIKLRSTNMAILTGTIFVTLNT